MMYDDMTLFDLRPLAGPYYAETNVNGALKKLEVRFCGPAYVNEEQDKSALVFFIDDSNKRVTRLTSGSATMDTINTIRKIDDSTVVGVFYTADHIEGAEFCKEASGETPAVPYTVDYTVTCGSGDR